MESKPLGRELIEHLLRARSSTERMVVLKTGEWAGSRPKPPEAVARPAPALRPTDCPVYLTAQLLSRDGMAKDKQVIWV